MLATISVLHLCNLRHSQGYQKQRRHFTKTQSRQVPISELRKPQPNGEPDYIRIDTVHQGDLDKQKGVYHINAVDEVTQFEVVCSVERIRERYLIPVLTQMIALNTSTNTCENYSPNLNQSSLNHAQDTQTIMP
jgi:hypothetical protein